MKRLAAGMVAAAALLSAPHVGVAQSKEVTSEIKTETGVVEAIEAQSRSVTIRRPDGTVVTTVAGPNVKGFESIKIGDKGEKGTFTLDPQKTPKAMDIFPTEGDNNGKTLLAIYELAGDQLTICYSLTPTVRPEDFKADSNTLLVVKFERLKE